MPLSDARAGGKPIVPCTAISSNMRRRYDHIDLRVPRLAEVTPFYELLLPALGFTRNVSSEDWLQFEAADGDITAFFGITESSRHIANENRIAFWAEDQGEVDRIAKMARDAGAQNIEGPMQYEPGYYAVFFEDPCGNRLEVCHRVKA
jgi:predicted enzyme related to lactoylglutathione lyase